MSPRISWQELDKSLLNLTPAEALATSTAWSAQRPADEPWLAVIKPLSDDVVSISLSLDAYHEFSSEIRDSFRALSEQLHAECSADEITAMEKDERTRGNTGALTRVTSGLLRVLLPARLSGRAKAVIAERLDQLEAEPVIGKAET